MAAREAQVHGEADQDSDREARDRMMGQGIGAVAMVIVAVDVVEETSHVSTQRHIESEERLASPPTMGCRLLQQEADAPTIDFALPPRSIGENAAQVGVTGALQEAASEMGQALIRGND